MQHKSSETSGLLYAREILSLPANDIQKHHLNTLLKYISDAPDPKDSEYIEEIITACEFVKENMRKGDSDTGCEDIIRKEDKHLEEITRDWQEINKTETFFADIIGLKSVKEVISEAILEPIKYPYLFSKIKAKKWKGLLLFGPPGTGKTLIARATASETDCNFFKASCADLTSKWVGGSEKLIRSLFEDARQKSPSIIFLDEIDSIASTRTSDKTTSDQRMTNQLLIELDNNYYQKFDTFVMAATNLPWQLDNAIVRRFPKMIYVPLPDADERKEMLLKNLSSVCQLSDNEIQKLVEKTEYFSGSDISNMMNDIYLEPMRILRRSTTFHVYTIPQGESNVRYLISTSLESVDSGTIFSQTVHEKNLSDIVDQYTEEAILIPAITYMTIEKIIAKSKRSIGRDSIQCYNDFNLNNT